jgi:uncharacterized Ntn-hydrolase superfamily protein
MTYSIIAHDTKTGQFGVAVQTHWFGVGALVPWAETGVGAVATQADVDMSYGSLGLMLMRAGKSAQQAIDALLSADNEQETRQVAMIDAHGSIAVHTGSRCIAEAGHVVGNGFSVQGNLLESNKVWPKMAEAFDIAQGDLPERLLTALEAGEDAGGDVRGKQSAALLVVPSPDDPLGSDAIVNVRVDDHARPLRELRRVFTVRRAYQWVSEATHAIKNGDIDEARRIYVNLRGLVVGTREPLFWYATALVEAGHVDEALITFGEVFAVEPVWKELIDRLVVAESFPNDAAIIKKVKALPAGARTKKDSRD